MCKIKSGKAKYKLIMACISALVIIGILVFMMKKMDGQGESDLIIVMKHLKGNIECNISNRLTRKRIKGATIALNHIEPIGTIGRSNLYMEKSDDNGCAIFTMDTIYCAHIEEKDNSFNCLNPFIVEILVLIPDYEVYSTRFCLVDSTTTFSGIKNLNIFLEPMKPKD
jgi:hypothetical protein